jgi:hypothetical protein
MVNFNFNFDHDVNQSARARINEFVFSDHDLSIYDFERKLVRVISIMHA